jgi:hypothetical protein
LDVPHFQEWALAHAKPVQRRRVLN